MTENSIEQRNASLLMRLHKMDVPIPPQYLDPITKTLMTVPTFVQYLGETIDEATLANPRARLPRYGEPGYPPKTFVNVSLLKEITKWRADMLRLHMPQAYRMDLLEQHIAARTTVDPLGLPLIAGTQQNEEALINPHVTVHQVQGNPECVGGKIPISVVIPSTTQTQPTMALPKVPCLPRKPVGNPRRKPPPQLTQKDPWKLSYNFQPSPEEEEKEISVPRRRRKDTEKSKDEVRMSYMRINMHDPYDTRNNAPKGSPAHLTSLEAVKGWVNSMKPFKGPMKRFIVPRQGEAEAPTVRLHSLPHVTRDQKSMYRAMRIHAAHFDELKQLFGSKYEKLTLQ